FDINARTVLLFELRPPNVDGPSAIRLIDIDYSHNRGYPRTSCGPGHRISLPVICRRRSKRNRVGGRRASDSIIAQGEFEASSGIIIFDPDREGPSLRIASSG